QLLYRSCFDGVPLVIRKCLSAKTPWVQQQAFSFLPQRMLSVTQIRRSHIQQYSQKLLCLSQALEVRPPGEFSRQTALFPTWPNLSGVFRSRCNLGRD